MAEKTDWTKLSKHELQEILRRQEKLLNNKKLLQSLPDKGNKVLATIERLKELIARREEVDNTVAQFERMTVSHLVERSRQNLSESDDEISECKDFASEAHEELSPAHNKKDEMSKSKSGQKKQISYRKWDYESSVTPPLYKFEKAKPVPLDQSFKLLQDQEKRYKDLQAQNATIKLKNQGSSSGTESMMLDLVKNSLQYRETIQEQSGSDDDECQEEERKPIEVDSDDSD
ncbi:DNA-directed RNA polymerase II subunit GRINL1A-like [Acropora muricata]|uniref:DNA-directed RNA polymerase II subunit GRINL1A-like n=1 Tax=Acropora muricata TaxID=159855 RepID=UPI0034E53E8C